MKTKNHPEKKNQRRKKALASLKGKINNLQQKLEGTKNKEKKKALRKKRRKAIEERGTLENRVMDSAREIRTKKQRG